ncbi:MAG: class I SAM-dependent DNA methyltransferase [Ferruginibacter sp.]
MTTKTKKEKVAKKSIPQKMEETQAQRLSGIIKTCRNVMRKDKGMNGDGDRLPMLTWIMFLKFLDDNETLLETQAALKNKKYKAAIEIPYRWRDWAKDKNLTGDDLLAFINNEKVKLADGKEKTGLLYYLRGLQSETGTERKDVIATVFKGITNRMINGYLLRDVVNKIDEIHFTNNEEINTLSHLYESILKEMRDASGDAGEFYTPRPVVKFMVEMLDPKIGETVLDPASGTGGFLVEAFEHLKKQAKTVEQQEILQSKSIIGGEAKPLPYLLCQMNLLLHGLNYPNIDSRNSLRKPLRDIGDSERVQIILTNPPFGGEEEKGILNNFPDDKKTAETALLFLQLIMRKLKKKKPTSEGGRAAIVVPHGTLFADGIAARVKKQLVDEFNLHTIVRLGEGIFAPYTNIPCNLLFFQQGEPTKEIWYYELLPPDGRKNYSKTKPIQHEEFIEIKKWWAKRQESDVAWKAKLKDILLKDEEGKLLNVNLDLKNPNRKGEFEYIEPTVLISSILEKEKEVMQLMKEIESTIQTTVGNEA